MDPLIIILAALFLLAVGFFAIGIYLSMRGKQKSAPPRNESLAEARDEALREQGIREIARLLRDQRSGTLLLEKNGVIYRLAADLSPEERRVLAAAAGDLHVWLGLSVSKREEPAGDLSRQEAEKSEAQKPAPTPLQARLRAANKGSEDIPTKPPSMNPVDVFSRALASEVPKIDFESKSITAQIDAILQEKLTGTPLEQRGIRLLDSPEGGVVVFVGIENYDGVDAVPDEEVRRAIREAVAEWEKRSS